ncbi:PTH2-domain-containing protein [Hypoxylon rubiginosum]|uniref:PTH2-domain-containing protein n=1 Tax=Hypoxylon rubiginosum TaxID=110542 RepID=A0ACC0D8R3_9PEZI|nr:PTH2-domain-containing protein [Hypoxylon rubiginosum]
MADRTVTFTTGMIVSTSIVAFISGFMLGMYSIRGYLFISPSLESERRQILTDMPESDESDIDEDDTILDHAPNWANGEDADRRDGLRVPEPKKTKKSKAAKKDEYKDEKAETTASAHPPVAEGTANEECKLVLVVRTDLGMTKGKIAAQCSHATLACYKTLSRAAARKPSSPEARLLQRWERRGQAKIAVQVKSEAELLDLMGKARSLGITAEVIQDAGRTQIDPGSLTVLGVGPAPKSLVDQVTGGLKLL